MNRKSMTKFVAGTAIAAGLSFGATQARAGITFDPDAGGPAAAVNNVTQLDWAPGNTLAVGGDTAVQNFLANKADGGSRDTTFTTLYQANLAQLGTQGGGTVAPSGWEITVVAKFQENVTSVDTTDPTDVMANFKVVNNAANYVEIYASAPNASNLNGTGFNDGTQILQGTITGGASNLDVNTTDIQPLDTNDLTKYTGITTVSSVLGSIQISNLQITINSFDSSYFLTALHTLTLNFSGTSQIPFTNIDPSASFLINSTNTALGSTPALAGAGDPTNATYGIGSINGVNGPSIQFEADGNSAVNGSPLTFVPEPATAALGLVSLLGLAAASRRRRRA